MKKCRERKDALQLNLESFVNAVLMKKITGKKEWADIRRRKREAIVKNIEDMIKFCPKK